MNDDRDSADDVFPELPDHLIYDIFLKLPPTKLFRFRTLSKQWRRIISTPAVYNMIASWSEDARNNRLIATRSLPPPASLRFPTKIGHRYGYISPSSSSHGILCLRFTYWNGYTPFISLWNPVTGQSLPMLCPARHYYSSFVGFGYDDVTDDYKIVFANSVLTDGFDKAQIMSLRSKNRKRRIIDTSSWGLRISNSVTIGGDIYWISYIARQQISRENCTAYQHLSEDRNWIYVVLKFNVTAESLTVLPSPFQKRHSENKKLELGQYKGSLCFFSIDMSFFSDNAHWANIWTLPQDKNGKVIWKSLMDVPYSPFLQQRGRECKLEFTTTGDLIICYAGYGLLVYLPQQKRYLKVPFNEHDPKHDQLKLARDFYFLQNESLLFPLSSEQ